MEYTTYISVKEWANKNGVSVSTAYAVIKRGEAPSKIGESGEIQILSDFRYVKKKSRPKEKRNCMEENTIQEPTFITPAEWAKKVGVSRTMVYSLYKDGKIILPFSGKATLKINGRLMVHRDAVRKDMSKPKGALSGKRVENVEILEKTEEKRGTHWIYKCLCHFCGKEFLANGADVIRGDVYSCGCQKGNMARLALESDRVDGTRLSLLKAKIRSDNTSGHKGVALQKGAWQAYIDFKGKRYDLGRYGQDYQKAVEARERAEQEIFGGFFEDIAAKSDAEESAVTEEEVADQKGVYFRCNSWRVVTVKNGEYYYWGSFRRFIDARDMYDKVKDLKDPADLSRAQKKLKKRKYENKRKVLRAEQENSTNNRIFTANVNEVTQSGKPAYRVTRSIEHIRVYLGTYKDRKNAEAVAGIANTCVSLDELVALKDLLYSGGKIPSKKVVALAKSCNCVQDLFLLVNR